MKRSIFFITLVLLAAGLFAQTGNDRTRRFRTPPEPPALVTVSGNLAFIDARIGVKSGDTTYYIIGIDRLIGFVDGLKEGAAVNLEGYEFFAAAGLEYRYLRVVKLNFNGKDYEVSPRFQRSAEGSDNPRFFNGPGPMGRGHSDFFGPRGPRKNSRHHFEW
jgi:hypothetical protein